MLTRTTTQRPLRETGPSVGPSEVWSILFRAVNMIRTSSEPAIKQAIDPEPERAVYQCEVLYMEIYMELLLCGMQNSYYKTSLSLPNFPLSLWSVTCGQSHLFGI